MTENDPSWPTGDTPDDSSGSTPPPPPPPPAPATPAAPGVRTGDATLGVRFAARLIDGIILGIVQAFILVPLIVGTILSEDLGATSTLTTGFSFASIVASLVGLALTFGYFVYFETSRGWTPGKKLLNLEVRGAAGGHPTVEESVRRNAFYALSIIPGLGGLLQLAAVIYIAVTINSNADNHGVHDEFAGGTRVVRD